MAVQAQQASSLSHMSLFATERFVDCFCVTAKSRCSDWIVFLFAHIL